MAPLAFLGAAMCPLMFALALRILLLGAVWVTSVGGSVKPQRAIVTLSYATALLLPPALLVGGGRGLLPPPLQSPLDVGGASAIRVGLLMLPGVLATLWAVWRVVAACATGWRRAY